MRRRATVRPPPPSRCPVGPARAAETAAGLAAADCRIAAEAVVMVVEGEDEGEEEQEHRYLLPRLLRPDSHTHFEGYDQLP